MVETDGKVLIIQQELSWLKAESAELLDRLIKMLLKLLEIKNRIQELETRKEQL